MPGHEILESQEIRSRRGWFLSGFAVALIIVATFLYFDGYFSAPEASQLDPSTTIIEGR